MPEILNGEERRLNKMTDRNEMNKNNELDEQELEQATGGTSPFGGTSYVYCRCTKCGNEQRFEKIFGHAFYPKMCNKCGGGLVEI